jgi:hypothetical protein
MPSPSLADAVRRWLDQRAWTESEHFGVSQLINTLETPDDAFRLRALDTPLGDHEDDVWAYISRTLFLAATHPDMFASSSPTQAPRALIDNGASFCPLHLASVMLHHTTWSPQVFLRRLLCDKTMSRSTSSSSSSSSLSSSPSALSPRSLVRSCKRAFSGGNTSAEQLCRLLDELGRTPAPTTSSTTLSKDLRTRMNETREHLWVDRIKRETIEWQQQVGYAAIASRLRGNTIYTRS